MDFWRGHLRKRCPKCNQRTQSSLTMVQQIAQRNARQRRLAGMFERRPRSQVCEKCGQVIFEGEFGFDWDPLLLIDWDARKKIADSQVAHAS